MLACLGFGGRLADAEYALNLRAGLTYLGMALSIWGVTGASYFWCIGQFPTRYSLRTILTAVTAFVIAVGAVVAMLNAFPS